MRTLTFAELEFLAFMRAHAFEFANCTPACSDFLAIRPPSELVTALVQAHRIETWPCAFTQFKHGRVTAAGHLALRLQMVVR